MAIAKPTCPDLEAARVGRDVPGDGAPLTENLAQVSREALQGEGLDAVLQCIVVCLSASKPGR